MVEFQVMRSGVTFDIGSNEISIMSHKIRMSAWWGSYGDGQWNIVALGAKQMQSPTRVCLLYTGKRNEGWMIRRLSAANCLASSPDLRQILDLDH